MTVESVRAHFRERGLEYEIHEFGESTETVDLAAQALGVEPELIAKTLAFKVRERGVLVVTRGNARIEKGYPELHRTNYRASRRLLLRSLGIRGIL